MLSGPAHFQLMFNSQLQFQRNIKYTPDRLLRPSREIKGIQHNEWHHHLLFQYDTVTSYIMKLASCYILLIFLVRCITCYIVFLMQEFARNCWSASNWGTGSHLIFSSVSGITYRNHKIPNKCLLNDSISHGIIPGLVTAHHELTLQ